MNAFMDHLENILSPDLATLGVVAVLCAIAAYFIKELLAHPPVIVFIYPVMVFIGLAAYYMFVQTDQLNPKKMDQWLMWTILASICGTVLGIGLISIVAAVREKLGSRRPPATQTRPTRAIR